MKPDVLVDTSVWIEYFNRPGSRFGESVDQILKKGRVACAGIVLTELLQGAKIKKEFDALLEVLSILPYLETTLNTWIEAGKMSYALRRKGITIPTTDLIIAGLALQNECLVFTSDPHFHEIPGVKMYDV